MKPKTVVLLGIAATALACVLTAVLRATTTVPGFVAGSGAFRYAPAVFALLTIVTGYGVARKILNGEGVAGGGYRQSIPPANSASQALLWATCHLVIRAVIVGAAGVGMWYTTANRALSLSLPAGALAYLVTVYGRLDDMAQTASEAFRKRYHSEK